MNSPSRFLLGGGEKSYMGPPPPQLEVDSDFVVIMAALLCALICVLGLVAVARCACLRRLPSAAGSAAAAASPPDLPNKGVKKKILRSLPKVSFSVELGVKFTECAICLAEFGEGEEIRELPQCGHAFHVSCIDTWLGSHSSCPSCRHILVLTRCHNCGGFPPTSSDSASASASTFNVSDDNKDSSTSLNTFLP